MFRKLLAFTVCSAVSTATMALDLQIAPGTTQDSFTSVSKDVIATLNYKALGASAATGISGFGVAAVASYVPTLDSAAWRNVTGESVDALGLIGVSVSKGLLLNLDAGAFYSMIPTTNVKIYGGELRYALLPGSATQPAVAVRGTYSRAAGISGFDADAYGFDLSVSKGFTVLTPYAGLGYVAGTSDPHGTLGLRKVEVNALHVFAGARLSLGLFDLVPEFERIGDNNAFNLKVGVSI